MRYLDQDQFICLPCAEDREWALKDKENWVNTLECDECHEVKEVYSVRDFRKGES